MQYPTHITTHWIHLLVFSHARRADRIKFKNRSRWLRGGEGAGEGWRWSLGWGWDVGACTCARWGKKRNFLISHSTHFRATVVLMPDLTVCQTKGFTLRLDMLSNYRSASVGRGAGGWGWSTELQPVYSGSHCGLGCPQPHWSAWIKMTHACEA